MMRIILATAALTAAAQSAVAQLPQTRLYSLMPPGIPPGQISDVHINTGADLDEVDQLLFNHPGIFATPKRKTDDQERFQRVPNAFRVAVEPDVPPGRYEVRAVGLFGTSNTRSLIIDPRPALGEAEPNNTPPQAQVINVGTLVDGQINGAGDVDIFRFEALQGERIILDCLAERIDSRLNPMLTLSNADAKPIAFAQNEHGRDAFLVFDVPADGDYFLELRDETFAGGGEHFYRLQIHRGPHIRFVMPPAGPAGTQTRFTLYGYNLTGSEPENCSTSRCPLEKLDVEISIPEKGHALSGTPAVEAGLDRFSYRLPQENGLSNTVTIGLASAPVVLEQEPNNEPANAQPLSVPFEVAGQLDAVYDIDRFAFDATKDQQLWIEVIGQRAGARMDPFLSIEQVTIGADGVEQVKTLTMQDDTGTNLAANVFDTTTDDPAYSFKAPQTGSYRITLRDRSAGSRPDPSRVYRMIVREPRPDFRLVAIPSGQPAGQTWPVSPLRGDHFSLDVLAFRREGFEGPIEVRPIELPPGVTTRGTVIRENETSATLVLTASLLASTRPAAIRLVGAARVSAPLGAVAVEHPVRSGGVVWSRDGNTPAISRLESELVAAVSEQVAPYQISFDTTPMSAHQGRQLLIPMTLDRRSCDDKLTLKFDDAIKKAKVEAVELTFEPGQNTQTCRLFVRPDAPAGVYVIGGHCEAQVSYSRNPLQVEATTTAKLIAEREAQRASAASGEATRRVNAQTQVLDQANKSLQDAESAKETADSQLQSARDGLATLKQRHVAAKEQVAELTKQLETSTAELEAATKSAAATPDEVELNAQLQQAQATVDEQEAALASAQNAETEAEKQVTLAEATIPPAMDAQVAAQRGLAQAQTASEAAQQSMEQLNTQVEIAVSQLKAAEAARVAAEKAASEAASAAKPKNTAVQQPIPPLILTIKPAPVRLDVKPASGEVKAGESVEVAVTIERQNNFAGPVKLTLPMPDGRPGLSAPEVTIAADADSGVLSVQASDEAAEGGVPHLVVRATMESGGEAIIDAPLTLKVVK